MWVAGGYLHAVDISATNTVGDDFFAYDGTESVRCSVSVSTSDGHTPWS